jgi:hypothetical protein
MEASSRDAPFDDPGYLFEPWWPGARAIVLVERGRLQLQVSGLSDALAAFPELVELPDRLAEDGACPAADARVVLPTWPATCCGPVASR